MTIQAWWLLRKLKKAQKYLDGCVGITEDGMRVVAIHNSNQSVKSVSIKGYKNSLEATLQYLEDQGYIKSIGEEIVQVTYTGWHLLSATAVEVTKIVLLNVVLPIVVSAIAAIITTQMITGN